MDERPEALPANEAAEVHAAFDALIRRPSAAARREAVAYHSKRNDLVYARLQRLGYADGFPRPVEEAGGMRVAQINGVISSEIVTGASVREPEWGFTNPKPDISKSLEQITKQETTDDKAQAKPRRRRPAADQ